MRRYGKLNFGLVLLALAMAAALWGLAEAALAADTYPITGTVTLADGRAVENVAIYLDGELAARTDRTGQYMIPAAPAGRRLLQPVQEGLTFVPEAVELTLPPEAAGVNFTAFAAAGGSDSTSAPLPALPPQTFWQALLGWVSRWLSVVQQLNILMLVLSCGAFLALAARRLRSGAWNLSAWFGQRAAGETEGSEAWASPGTPPPAEWYEESFEEVASAQAPAGARRRVEPAAAARHIPSAADSAQAQPAPIPTAPSPAARTPAARIPVRRYTGTRRAEHIPAPEAEVSSDAVAQARALAERGDLMAAEGRLRQILQAEAGDADAWYWLSEVKRRQGDPRMAESCLRQAARLGHPQARQRFEGNW